MALDHPERVASLTLIATSPAGPEDADLPPMADRGCAPPSPRAAEPDWSDRAAVIDYLTDQWRARRDAGSRPFDEAGTRALARGSSIAPRTWSRA